MLTPITLIVADDHPIFRGGLRAALEDSAQVRIVGEVLVLEAIVPEVRRLQPDVAVIDLKWGPIGETALSCIAQLKRTSPRTRVVAISADHDLLLRARRVGADAVIGKECGRDQLIEAIRAAQVDGVRFQNSFPKVDQATLYREKLRQIVPGRRDANAYESLMSEVVPFLFEGQLTDFERQWRRREGEAIWDLVALNASADPFWKMLRQQHGAAHIVFEFKNVVVLGITAIRQAIDYSADRCVNLVVIMTRGSPGPSAVRKARSVWERTGKMILIVDDEGVTAMLGRVIDGYSPDEEIKRSYLALARCS